MAKTLLLFVCSHWKIPCDQILSSHRNCGFFRLDRYVCVGCGSVYCWSSERKHVVLGCGPPSACVQFNSRVQVNSQCSLDFTDTHKLKCLYKQKLESLWNNYLLCNESHQMYKNRNKNVLLCASVFVAAVGWFIQAEDQQCLTVCQNSHTKTTKYKR